MSIKKIVLTGGCGFIGHHFAEHVHKNTDWNIIIIDKLNYASKGLDRLRNNKLIESPRVKIFTIDLCNELSDGITAIFKKSIVFSNKNIAFFKYICKNIKASTLPLIIYN